MAAQRFREGLIWSPLMNPAQLNRLLRKIHLYVSVFFAPLLLFYGLTGAIQVLHLHEARGAYSPPPVIEKLGQVHIHQRYAEKPKRPAPPAGAQKAAAPKAPEREDPPAMGVLKAILVLSGLGLAGSSVVGVWISLLIPKGRKVALGLLAAGTVLPVLLVVLVS